jgi:membrane protease subunit HflK
MVDSRNSNQLLYLPFDKLLQQATQEAMAPRAATVTPAPEPAPATDGRTRDSLRSRDREVR